MRSAKFGARLRKLADTSDNNRKTKYECPRCGKRKVARKGYAIWKCKSCDSVYAGGAYSLKTETGEIALRLTRSYESA